MAITKAVRIELNARVGKKGIAQISTLQRTMKTVGRVATGAFQSFARGAFIVGAALTKATFDAKAFGEAMAEVSTIMDASNQEMQVFNDQVLQLSKDTGKAPEELAKALYQAVSAGIDAGDAMEFLGTATRAAIGGVATTSEAVDVLTNVLNSYGEAAGGVDRVSDIMFETVKKGKTTMSELAQNMGQVLPFAAELEVSLEDLFAATATLTKGGINTANAATFLKNALTSVLLPTEKAKAAAQQYGIDLSATALRSKGFLGFLDDIKTKTEGDTEALAKLFPNVRGLTAVLGLAGEQSEEFASIQDALTKSTGASGEAFSKVADSDAFKLNKALNDLKVLSVEIGTEFLPTAIEVVKEFGTVMRELTTGVGGFISQNPDFVAGLKEVAVIMVKIGVGAAKTLEFLYKVGEFGGTLLTGAVGVVADVVEGSGAEQRGVEAFNAGIARQRARGVNLGDQMNQAADGAANAVEQAALEELEKRNQARLQRA